MNKSKISALITTTIFLIGGFIIIVNKRIKGFQLSENESYIVGGGLIFISTVLIIILFKAK